MSACSPEPGRRAVAVVDDDENVRVGMGNLMNAIGFDVELFESAAALLAGDLGRFSCILSDMQMPGMSGLDLQRELSRRVPTLPIIFITGYPDQRVREVALAGGALGFFEKPCDIEELVSAIELAHS